MRLSLVLSDIRDLIGDQSVDDWTDVELVRYINLHTQSRVRKMTEIDEGYHNCELHLSKDDARQMAASTWEYTIPSWVMKITMVRKDPLDVTASSQRIFFPGNKYELTTGWRYNELNGLRFQRMSEAEDILISAMKRPALCTMATLPDQTGMGRDQMRLDSEVTTTFPQEGIEDSYINGRFELTGVSSVGRAVRGQYRRCIKSEHGCLFTDPETKVPQPYTVLTFNQDWDEPPMENDTYEMHPEIPDEHMRLIVLDVARTAWMKKGNSDEIRAMASEYQEQMLSFISHIRPRQLQEPLRIRSSTPFHNGTEFSDDNAYGYWGW